MPPAAPPPVPVTYARMLIRSQRRFDAERNRAASFPSPLVHSAIGRPVHASLPAAHRTLGLPALAAA